jgi:hypothetical protein
LIDRVDALNAAKSTDPEERIRASERLAVSIDAETSRALLLLLLDPDDTAVTQSATKALLHRQDVGGATLVFEALATADFDQSQEILETIRSARNEGLAIEALARSVTETQETKSVSGALLALKWLAEGRE